MKPEDIFREARKRCELETNPYPNWNWYVTYGLIPSKFSIGDGEWAKEVVDYLVAVKGLLKGRKVNMLVAKEIIRQWGPQQAANLNVAAKLGSTDWMRLLRVANGLAENELKLDQLAKEYKDKEPRKSARYNTILSAVQKCKSDVVKELLQN